MPASASVHGDGLLAVTGRRVTRRPAAWPLDARGGPAVPAPWQGVRRRSLQARRAASVAGGLRAGRGRAILTTMDPSGHPHPAFEAAAAAIVAAGRRLGSRRLVTGCDGNLSIRLGPFALAVTPTGRRKDELAPGEILAVPLDEQQAPPGDHRRRPSSDLAVHRAAYTARAEAQAIVHAHPPAVLACLLAGVLPDTAVLPEAHAVVGRLAYVPALPFGGPAVAAAVAAALRDPAVGAVLLDRHGVLTVGRTLDEAVDRLEVVELLCATWQAARAAGSDPRRRARGRLVPGAAARTPPPLRRHP